MPSVAAGACSGGFNIAFDESEPGVAETDVGEYGVEGKGAGKLSK